MKKFKKDAKNLMVAGMGIAVGSQVLSGSGFTGDAATAASGATAGLGIMAKGMKPMAGLSVMGGVVRTIKKLDKKVKL